MGNPFVFHGIRSHARPKECAHTVELLSKLGIVPTVFVSEQQKADYLPLHPDVGIGAAGCNDNTQAILHAAKEAAGDRQQIHVVIWDDNQQYIRLAGVNATADLWRRFETHAWNELVRTGASGWSAFATANTYGVQHHVLHPGTSGLKLLYGVVFGVRLCANYNAWHCKHGGICDDVERSLRLYRHGGGNIQFPQLRVTKKAASTLNMSDTFCY